LDAAPKYWRRAPDDGPLKPLNMFG
jgi:hypothetical protein